MEERAGITVTVIEVFCGFWLVPSDIITDVVRTLSSLLVFDSIAEFGIGIVNRRGGECWVTCWRIWLNEKMI